MVSCFFLCPDADCSRINLLLRECGGTIQTFQVLNNGISKSVFYAYVKERGLEQASHGVYVSPDTWTDAMFLLHLRCGQAVFSHETALFFHDLTVKFKEDGSFQYLGNEIRKEDRNNVPEYQYRVKGEIKNGS